MSFSILGTGSSTPAKVVTNFDLAEIMETSDEWIRTRTGIAERRVVTTETATSLSTAAARAAISNAGIDPNEIDLIVCSTMRGDFFTPAQACAVGEALGLNVPAFDINAACSGLMYAFETVDSFIESGRAQTALIVTVELLSKLTDWNDRSTCVLFGDGASAVVVRKGPGLIATHIACQCNTSTIYGTHLVGNSPFDTADKPASVLHMNGQETYRFAVGTMMTEIETVLGKAGLTTADVDWFLPHQANSRIIDAAAARMKIAGERVLVNIGKHGNVSSTSIGLLLDEAARADTFKRGDKLLMVAFGAGLTSGAALIEWTK
ncbi:MAG: ketoacyl-ACP synthase III [Clostridia bacterium]|jgi:3-oxoacyl-[acyl-carrier-protein] synthase-3|nr:ketoacyl-ACP synthase III [Clostridia bacterium]